MTVSKTGPHVTNGTPEALSWVRRAPIVKGLDNVDALRQAPLGAVRVFRHYFGSQPFGPGTGVAAANAVIAALGGYNHPELFVELYNEVGQELDPDGSPGALGQHLDFWAQALPILHAAGYRCAFLSFGTGQPGRKDGEPGTTEENCAAAWQYILMRLRAAGANLNPDDPRCDRVAVHEYTPDGSIDGWNMGRMRRIAGWAGQRVPLVATEWGWDSGPRPGGSGNDGGYRARTSEDTYYVLLANAEVEVLEAVSDCAGATVFGAGCNPDWSNFEFDDPREQFSMAGGDMATEAQVQAALATAGATMTEIDQMFADFAVWAAGNGANTGDFAQFGVYCEGAWASWQTKYGLGQLTLDGATYGRAQEGETYVAVDPNDPVILTIKKQIADFTVALRDLTEGKYAGATGAAGQVVAIEGGSDPSLKPQPDYTPKA